MHKYLFVLFCLFSVANLNGQSWKAREVSDPFNGVYTSAYVLGKSSSSVYGQPTLSLNQYDNRELILYISNAGYFRENSDVSIKWVFEGSQCEVGARVMSSPRSKYREYKRKMEDWCKLFEQVCSHNLRTICRTHGCMPPAGVWTCANR